MGQRTYQVKCLHCGTVSEFPIVTGPRRKYCIGAECRNEYYAVRKRKPPEIRQCACGCGETFSVTSARTGKFTRRYFTQACKQRAWAVQMGTPAAKRYRREALLRSKYGLGIADYDRLVAEQGSRCQLCTRIPRSKLHVDHDHVTGRVRGLLCSRCNTALGVLGDNEMGVRRALRYMQGSDEFALNHGRKTQEGQ